MRAEFGAVLLFAAGGVSAPAAAQDMLSGSVEAVTDDRRRGLSWSDGNSALRGLVSLELTEALRVDGTVATTRNSPRHGGADAAGDLSAVYATGVGPVTIDGGVFGHFFPGGRGALNYAELGVGAGYALGPVQLDAYARYAPDQDAIGGDNLYLSVQARAGIPLTPFSVSAGVGRTSGSTDDPIRAARLRPGGNYTDWTLGIEHVTGPFALGVDYIGTDIGREGVVSPFADRRHARDTLLARASIRF